ncbi:serine/threonine-protein kinase [Nostoc sp. UHCC 0870]|uniref:serine/threonine-protein kinase n=1 Tax=Nostoc sp. UHCC 0870 TaxID=2914041 RepID=UPI001EDE3DFE|nr:serine/threonine-protein kinase [Nostoc sp. UHCC 0870]UKO96059.1 serine/threonine-protein kinase [Nostoc sp. UHCC 0870]
MTWASGQHLQGGKYTIEHELGEGGFGITYRAKDNYGRLVVIKTLNDQVQRRPDFAKFQQDFINEAIKLAKCSHPHIVQIHEVINEDSLWCIVMEYIDGENLASRVENQGVLSEAEALGYIQQIGEALTVVHNNGLLHRDVKPQNIMLRSGKTEAVLIDFGIAREFSHNLTQTHTGMLSDGFAPIEQYDKRTKRGAYTDVYALAATLYSILTGEVPTIAPIRAINTSLEEPIKINPSISNRVNQAILYGMQIKPENRPQSIEEWLPLIQLPLNANTSSSHLFFLSDLSSPVAMEYHRLNRLLAARNWKEADQQTRTLILCIANRSTEGWLRDKDIDTFPYQDLHIINQLWLEYSNERFGFTVQKRIWENVNKNVDRFGNRVGWRENKSWIKYSNYTFNLNAPEGHLPQFLEVLGFVWKSGWFGAYWDGNLSRLYSFISRLEKCKIK